MRVLTIAVLLCTALALPAATAIECEGQKVDVVPTQGQCPADWTGFQSRCFLFVKEVKSWIDAEKHCLKLGGNLASLHSLSEYQFIQKLTGDPLSWIGGHDAVEEGQWLWSDGSVFSYEKWYYPQPDNYGGKEHCLCYNAGSTKGWNDCPCSYVLPFVCALKRH